MATLTVHEYHTVEGHPEYLHSTRTNEWDGYTASQAHAEKIKRLTIVGRAYDEEDGALVLRRVIYPLRDGDERIDVREVLTWTD